MRSKEEILAKQRDAFLYIDESVIDGSIGGVYDAMDEYAKEVLMDALWRIRHDGIKISGDRAGWLLPAHPNYTSETDEKICEYIIQKQ